MLNYQLFVGEGADIVFSKLVIYTITYVHTLKNYVMAWNENICEK